MGFSKYCPFYGTVLLSLTLTLSGGPGIAGQLSVSTEVGENINILQETKKCPQCNLSGAVLNRMDLSGADLQGANLSRAKMFLTDLSGANLQNSDLREAQFGGADLANADLRGSDLTGTSLAGAYIGGALFDGEMVTTTPYKDDNIADVEETVYVEDTVKPKNLPETEDLTIASRRDFEETPPSVPVEATPIKAVTVETAVHKQSATGSAPKTVPVIQEVRIQDSGDAPQVILDDNTKKQPSQDEMPQSMTKEEPPTPEPQIPEEAAPVLDETVEIATTSQVTALGETETTEETPQIILSDNTKKQPSHDDTVQVMVKEDPPVGEPQIPVEAELALEETSAMAASSQGVTSEETDAAVAEVQTDSVENQTETPEESNAMVALQGEKEVQGAASLDGTEKSHIVEPEATGNVVAETQIVEEIAQVNEGVNEFEEKLSIHGPGSELLENIAILLDTNQCYGCNLSGADLRGENLGEADLEGADLSNALLQNVDLEGANLKGTNLSGADLTDADLSEADCYKAVLTNADLTNANLENTLLDDADLSGAKGYQGTMMMMQGNEP